MSGPEPGPQPDARVDRPLSEPAEFNESEFRAQLLQYVIQTESAMNNTREIHRVHGNVLYGDVSFALEKLKQARQDDPVYRGLSLRKIIDVAYQSPQHSDADKQRIMTCTIDQLASQLTVFVSLQTIIKSAIQRMTPDQ